MKTRTSIVMAITVYGLTLTNCSKDGMNGADGVNGKNSLIRLVAEPQGQNCPAGGYAILTGLDVDENDTLDPAEVENTSYLCNGSSLGSIGTINVLPGSACPSGGYGILTGDDVNGNGILDASEVLDTSFLCNDSGNLIKEYLVENHSTVTKSDAAWSDFMSTQIQITHDNSKILFMVDFSTTNGMGYDLIAFRGRADSLYSASSIITNTIGGLATQQNHVSFLLENVAQGEYIAAIQWKSLDGR